MLIAQITDLHIGFDAADPNEYNKQRLDQVLEKIVDGPNRPDLMLVTGDLAERGDPETYRRVAGILSACPFPWHPIPGNHDDRTSFSRAFPDLPTPGGFLQYVLELGPLRLILLDTLEEGRNGGGFCETRAAWLKARLEEDRSTPTVIAMHHPPMDVGIEWMRTHPGEPWVRRFADAISGADHLQSILCGHMHLPVTAPWRGTTVAICPSVAPGVTLDLRPIDAERPDYRPLVVADRPGFAMHWWNGTELVTMFDYAGAAVPLTKFDARSQGMVKHLLEERPVG